MHQDLALVLIMPSNGRGLGHISEPLVNFSEDKIGNYMIINGMVPTPITLSNFSVLNIIHRSIIIGLAAYMAYKFNCRMENKTLFKVTVSNENVKSGNIGLSVTVQVHLAPLPIVLATHLLILMSYAISFLI